VRILVIAADYPWPETGGSRVRLANTVLALAECGDVDLLSIVPTTRADTDFGEPPEGVRLSRVVRCAVDTSPPGPKEMLRAALHMYLHPHGRDKTPLGLTLAPTGAVLAAYQGLDPRSYDLVWCFTVRAWVWAGEPHSRPTIVDIDDLEDQKILARLRIAGPRASGPARIRQILATAFSRFEAGQWTRLHRRIDKVGLPVVCSEIDGDRSGLDHVRVIPNGYRSPEKTLGRTHVGETPTVMFQGTLRYPPNADAARFLASEIAPRLAALLPDSSVQLRLVGVTPPSLASEVGNPPLVTVVGPVPEMAGELARTDLVVVPLRFGSGTRIKILEAFAHRIPVVSTSLGAEGLGLKNGVHLLIADDARGIAEACASLLSDMELRQTIVENAHALFSERYESSIVQKKIRQLAEEFALNPA
jgi:glycosyltransferase involved in cell wall biosynthesis